MSKSEVTIAAQPRSEFGDNASRRLRKSGVIPAVIYGCGKPAVAISLKAEEWQVAYAKKADLYVVELDGQKYNTEVKEVQYNHLKDYVYHVDFKIVD